MSDISLDLSRDSLDNVIAVKPQVTTELRWFLHRICCELQKNPAKLETSSIRYELEFMLPCKILAALSGFREKLPKPNLRMRDLALRRVEDFLNAATTSHTITDLATQWGFWHMSQFAADYKRLFGELPSETI